MAQALRPFPQYYGVQTHRLNDGWSNYNSLQVTVTKRSTYGLSFLAAYTFSNALGTADTAGPGNYYDYGQNYYNRRADYSVTAYNFPQDLKRACGAHPRSDLPFPVRRFPLEFRTARIDYLQSCRLKIENSLPRWFRSAFCC